MNNDYTLWPNNGSLGENKIQIPDGVDTPWPEGDVLVRNFVYKNGKLVGFVDNKALINNDSSSTVIPYDYIDICLDRCLEDELNIITGERCKYLNIKFVDILPKGYKRLPYLESTGFQYINTGCYVTGASAFSARLAVLTQVSQYGTIGLLGCLDAWKANMFGLVLDFARFELRYNATVYNTFAPEPGRVYNTSYADGVFRIGEEVERTVPVAPEMEVSAPFGLFCYLGPEGTPYNGQVHMRIHHATLLAKDGKRVFIPALDDTGAPCMYDSITHTTFYNSGSEDFLYPNMNTQSTYSLRERKYAKMTEHGIRRLYKVPDDVDMSKDEYAMVNGFKELVENTIPHEGNWIPQWSETDTQVICNWIETPIEETI